MESALELLARDVCRELLQRSLLARDAMGVSWKGENDPVTLADQAAHAMVAAALPSFSPGIPLISEEDEDRPFEGDAFWSLDPVDGTQEFMEHLGEWAFQLAMVRQGQPVLAVLGIPSRDTLYLAVAGKGCRSGSLQETSTLAPFRSHSPQRRERLVLTRSLPRRPALVALVEHHASQDQVLLGGVGYKVHAVLAGEGDTYFAAPGTLHAWDLAAPLLVAREAGLATMSLDGQELTVPSHRKGLSQGVLFTRESFLQGNLDFFARPQIAELLARRDPR